MPWMQLGRLRERCDVTIASRIVKDKEERLRWRMTVRKRGDPQGQTITTEADDITDAVRQGVQEALRVGLLPGSGAGTLG